MFQWFIHRQYSLSAGADCKREPISHYSVSVERQGPKGKGILESYVVKLSQYFYSTVWVKQQ